MQTFLIRFLILTLLAVAISPAYAQPSGMQCIANIQKRLDSLGNQTDFDFLKARQIVRDFDFGKVSEFAADATGGKKMAFQRVWMSLAEFCDVAGNSLSAKGMKGYTKLSGGVIRADGTNFIADLKKVFGGQNFDSGGFNQVMEHIDNSGKWLAQGKWESPGGLVFRADSAEGHRLTHALTHSIDNPAKESHGVWNLSRKDILTTIDDGWKNRPSVQDVTQGGRRRVVKDYGTQVGKYDSGWQGGNTSPGSMTHIAYIIENGNEVISAFPVSSSFRF
jgi:hypothetical protein